MELESPLIGRSADVQYLALNAAAGKSSALVGVSNLGKSAVMRSLCDPPKRPDRNGTFIYVDCNEMPERTSRAFFIAAWGALVSMLKQQAGTKRGTRAQDLYEELVHLPDSTGVGTHYDEGLAWAMDRLPHPIVLCLDEFDEAFQGLEPQTFLNLRALKDHYGSALAYITATEREPVNLIANREQGEFYELIAPRVRFLHFWEPEETRAYARHLAEREQVTFDDLDLAFILEQGGGHPGLVRTLCYALGAVTGAPIRDRDQDRVIHQLVKAGLAGNPDVRSECQKVWNDLEPDERQVLIQLPSLREQDPSDPMGAAWARLKAKFIVRDSPEGPVLFARVFQDYIRRQQAIQQPDNHGVYVDVDAGEVRVEGRSVGPLTDLEYRLVLFLYGRLDRVCDKYSIVEAVWGQDYVDRVDDARIEKLVSRVRQKIEPDPARPRYLHSLRGRGYKLVR